MFFTNKLTNPSNIDDNLIYHYSKEFIENGDSFILSVGMANNKGVITCTGSDGAFRWQREYEIPWSVAIGFYKVIQLIHNSWSDEKGQDAELTILGAFQYIIMARSKDSGYSLISINNYGEILWSRRLNYYDKGYFYITESKSDSSVFYVVLSKRNEKKYYYSSSINALVVDYYGNIIIQKELSNSEYKNLIVNDIHSNGNGLVIVGRYINNSSSGSTAFFTEVNLYLQYIDASNFTSHNVKFHSVIKTTSQNYCISGYSKETNSLFLITNYLHHNAQTIFTVSNSTNCHSKVFENNGILYLFQYNSAYGILHKIVNNNNIVWSKRIDIPNQNGIKDINFNKITESFTLTTFNQEYPTLLIRTDSEFNSCNTTSLNPSSLYQDSRYLLSNQLPLFLQNSSITTDHLEISNVVVTKAETNLCKSPETSGCEIYMAIVVDESGSIDDNEANQIREGLRNFINAQVNSNITLSLIGMSDQNLDVRSHHIIEKKISINSTTFIQWINKYRDRIGEGISSESDFWASGLSRVNELGTPNSPNTTIPDIVVVITDGLQIRDYTSNSNDALSPLYASINSKSHIFIYGIKDGWYGYPDGTYVDKLDEVLVYYLGRPAVKRSSVNSIMNSDYDSDINNFLDLKNALSNLTNELVANQVGCIANVDVVSDLNIPNNVFVFGSSFVNQYVGKIKLKNKSRVSFILPTSSPIHSQPPSKGLTFISKNENIIVGANTEEEIDIFVSGKIIEGGVINLPIIIAGVNNIQDFRIKASIVDDPIKGEIVASNLNIESYTIGLTPPGTYDYGYIEIKNNTATRDLVIDPGVNIWNEPNNSFSFRTKIDAAPIVIAAGLTEKVYIELVIPPNQPRIANHYSTLISFSNLSISNPQLFMIGFNVIEEELDVRVIGSTLKFSIAAGQYVNENTKIEGKFILHNFSQVRSFGISMDPEDLVKVHFPSADISGITFVINTETPQSINIPAGESREINVYALKNGRSIQSSNHSFPIRINVFDYDVINENGQHQVEFIVTPDVLDVELLNATFEFPKLFKDTPVENNLEVGTIYITNKSSLSLFTLRAHTTIHSGDDIDGLTFVTANNTNLTIGNNSMSVNVLMSGTPKDFGDFSQDIFIENVKNPNFKITFKVLDTGASVETNSETLLQSPNFTLQSVGSKGIDSPMGMQLRWMFSGNLGDKHLPKGEFATNENNYNKANDYVKLYRAAYKQSLPTTLDLSMPPYAADHDRRLWTYHVNTNLIGEVGLLGKSIVPKECVFYVYFRNKEKYDDLIKEYDPFSENVTFIQQYEDNIIEIECKDELFFKVTPFTNKLQNGDLYFEVLSVDENKLTASKLLSYRKKMTAIESKKAVIMVENGRSIRYKTDGFTLFSINFEFYSDFIAFASYYKAWQDLGEFSLPPGDINPKVLGMFATSINKKWLRYNDGEYVKGANYVDKWKLVPTSNTDLRKGIRDILGKYLNLSQFENNPKAEEILNIDLSNQDGTIISEPDDPNDEDGNTKISYLDFLKVSAMDYHVARLLGLGALDFPSDIASGAEYIYLTEYHTLKDPNDEKIVLSTPTQILSMSLPTSINTERLPLPVEIAELYKGVPRKQNDDLPVLYDAEGYSLDGKGRYISVMCKSVYSPEVNPSFFSGNYTWESSLYTPPIYAGLEFRKQNPGSIKTPWEKPELSHDTHYKNLNAAGADSNFETVPIILPESVDQPLYVHRQTTSGQFVYSTYAINIFSRAASNNQSSSILTTIKPANTLLPPSDVNAWLIQPEKPLMFTSQFEQDIYHGISEDDKTLVRLRLDYSASQDIVIHSIPLDSGITDQEYIIRPLDYFPDEYDVFADQMEVYFRKETPRSISASLFQISPSDNLSVIFRTKDYSLTSTGETLLSNFPLGTTANNFIGSLFIVNNKSYVIKNVWIEQGKLSFNVYKEEVSQSILAGGSIGVQYSSLTMPTTSGNDLFVVAENMQSTEVWGTLNRHSFKILLNYPSIKREIIKNVADNGSIQKYLEKSRGYWDTATIAAVGNDQPGIYKITLDNLELPIRISDDPTSFLERNNGTVRLFRTSHIDSYGEVIHTREIFKVFKVERFGREQFLNLYIYDENASNGDLIIEGRDLEVNYYPSFFLYLYKDISADISQKTILPQGDNLLKYSIFGLRSVSTTNLDVEDKIYKSRFTAPAMMFGRKLEQPEPPTMPMSSLYATRPDFNGKSTYSFVSKFTKKPFGLQFYRADNIAILNALYKPETLVVINENLRMLGGNNEEFLTNRWQDFFDFKHKDEKEYYKMFPGNISDDIKEDIEIRNPGEAVIEPDQMLEMPISFKLPNPDKEEFFEAINVFIRQHNANTHQTVGEIIPGSFGNLKLNIPIIPSVEGINKKMLLCDFIQNVVENCFVPLTEIPVIYQHIKQLPYLPLDKKQKVRDNAGYLLKPPVDPNLDKDFDMAPMMSILIKSENKLSFTDFTLTGTTDNLYFYASREMGSQMDMSEMSQVLGPVKLVDSKPLEAPKVLSALPILENMVLGITPKIKIEIQAYPEFLKAKKLNLYRATNRLDAESILSMTMVKTIDLTELDMTDITTWMIYDELEGFAQIPFGDSLYYRLTVEKEIQYAEPQSDFTIPVNIIIDYVPSQASRILALLLTETQNPETPILTGSGARSVDSDVINDVVLKWNQVCYKGAYHLYQMSTQGNWKEIAKLIVNQKNDKAQLQIYNPNNNENEWVNKEIIDIIDGQLSLPLSLLGTNYDQFSLFDQNNNRMYYHFKVVAENTSNMFSTQDNTLTLFTDDIWNDLTGISSDGISNGMMIEKTFIIK